MRSEPAANMRGGQQARGSPVTAVCMPRPCLDRTVPGGDVFWKASMQLAVCPWLADCSRLQRLETRTGSVRLRGSLPDWPISGPKAPRSLRFAQSEHLGEKPSAWYSRVGRCGRTAAIRGHWAGDGSELSHEHALCGAVLVLCCISACFETSDRCQPVKTPHGQAPGSLVAKNSYVSGETHIPLSHHLQPRGVEGKDGEEERGGGVEMLVGSKRACGGSA
ncbi:hypothetical protein B0T26DRAFT_464879 [Lasiosphaeria miniovina]|uniref:Uncharacterized protein n=1 Tax=Lasiosphaeria miniovina TaxID=1954250 RepID=A0AA39ZZW0_9PEZI|nr:uncharacterized protein B0T26DRAFT_464879 [Lasiosphaeria miniovina]KAK0706635.1 hypothetical protein B0T26DRAFT_464879 [Lasiosphaeria miniovina]